MKIITIHHDIILGSSVIFKDQYPRILDKRPLSDERLAITPVLTNKLINRRIRAPTEF